MDLPSSSSSSRRRKRRGAEHQRFASYLTFGGSTTVCMLLFLAAYAVTLLVLSPLLRQEAPTETTMKRGSVLKPVVRSAVERVKKLSSPLHHGNNGNGQVQTPGQVITEGIAGAVKRKWEDFRHNKGVTDAELLDKATREADELRNQKRVRRREFGSAGVVAAAGGGAGGTASKMQAFPAAPGKRTGFVVLGMHRSGTSLLSGLLANGLGYNTGGPLIGGHFDNVKGFFERIDVVLQNDEFMNQQKVWWNSNIPRYDSQKALDMKKESKLSFKEGQKALNFLNDPSNAPWLQKDPRMCITLKTWLPLLSSEPAVLFTYRHPLEVAMSLNRREKDFPVERGLRLWILYNERALKNSEGMCRVLSSNEAVFADPLKEVQRISDELTSKCGVPSPPEKLSKDVVDRFVDPSLQHHKKDEGDGDDRKEELANYDGCSVRDYDSSADPDSSEYQRERDLYLKAMKIYCDLQGGKAYEAGYEWPTL